MKNKLFAVYLGGRADGCNIELHDVVFVVGSSIEDTYPLLAQKWFGNHKWFHIDSYVELSYVDYFEIRLATEPCTNEYKLFFVNFGAYQPKLFGEIHQTAFYVVKDKSEAIARAKNDLCCNMLQTHCDDSLSVEDILSESDIDDIIEISEVDRFYLQIIPSEKKRDLEPQPGYRKIDVAKLSVST